MLLKQQKIYDLIVTVALTFVVWFGLFCVQEVPVEDIIRNIFSKSEAEPGVEAA